MVGKYTSGLSKTLSHKKHKPFVCPCQLLTALNLPSWVRVWDHLRTFQMFLCSSDKHLIVMDQEMWLAGHEH